MVFICDFKLNIYSTRSCKAWYVWYAILGMEDHMTSWIRFSEIHAALKIYLYIYFNYAIGKLQYSINFTIINWSGD